ncbi:DinB family protein [Paenibacillus albidus]|uniref:DinB family protein n=1 Tax=Paenibacillus albidus TaxID=2041023 RepID=UPI001BEAEA02|nr:DinB family protein [Paenibacillus albidus]MBT2290714.1 DinB family protein [Paenibacillus albidus]
MNSRPERQEYAEYYAEYIALVPSEGEYHLLLEQQSQQVQAMFGGLSEEKGDYRYAPGKWSIKEVLGHLIDTERIMSYRLLRIARGDKTPLAGFEEGDYVAAAGFGRFTLQELLGQYKAVRESTLALVASLPEEVSTRVGTANGNPISARAQAAILIGHELHHMNIIRERYLQ